METPKHQPFDSPLRWQVESSTDYHEPYLVDLGAPDPESCQCKHYLMVCVPHNRKGLGEVKRCKHYRIAKERFANWAIHAFYNHDQNTK